MPDGRQVAGEVIHHVRAQREIRDALMRLALWIDESVAHDGVLVFDDETIDFLAIAQDVDRLVRTLRADLTVRLRIAWREGGQLRNLPEDLDPAAVERLLETAAQRSSRPSVGHARFWVFHALLQDWLADPNRSRTATSLREVTGLSYPTIADALASFDRWIVRGPGRGVGLREFPWPLWNEMVTLADRARATRRFIDRTGIGRTPEDLLQRLRNLALPSRIAVGGIVAAHHHDQTIDLAGLPRLDLTIHQPFGEVDLDWIRELDPALEPTDDTDQKPALVVHVLHERQASFAQTAIGEVTDAADVLFDLADMRLTAQIEEFVNRRSRPGGGA